MTFTSDPNLWVISGLIFLLGLLVGMWMTAGGRRKWKSRYKEEAARCEGLKAEHDRVEQRHLAEREKEWRERDSLRGSRGQGRPRPVDESAARLTFDLREIRDPVDRVAEAHQQVQPPLALGRVGVVDRHMVEEFVDRLP